MTQPLPEIKYRVHWTVDYGAYRQSFTTGKMTYAEAVTFRDEQEKQDPLVKFEIKIA